MRLLYSLLCGSIAASALAGSPRVGTVYPSGGQRGAEIELLCTGSNLEDTTGALFDTPGFEVTPIGAEKGKVKLKVKVPADAKLGEHTFRVLTTSGVADLRLFYVSPYPLVEEKEPTKDEPADRVQAVALGTTVYGHTKEEDVDRYEVEAKKGQRITAEVIGSRLQSQNIYDPAVTIAKADGTPLVEVDDTAFTRQDPVATAVAPEDGKYIVSIKEATNSGAGECQYLLHLGAFSRPLAVYPPGGPAGEELKVRLLESTGATEQTVRLPAQPDEHWELHPAGESPAPSPNIVRVSPFPNVLEAEPNNAWAEASGVPTDEVPIAFNGLLETKGDIDFFRFTAKKDKVYEVTVWGRRLRSPVDSVLGIHDAKGNRIQLNDDSGSPDSYLRWTAPADGVFFVSVNDQLDRGGPLFTYRVEMTTVQPNIGVSLPEMVQNSSQERRQIVVPKGNRFASLVRVKRNDVAGTIQMLAEGLPPGITMQAGEIAKDVDTIAMTFEATADAANAAASFVLAAKLTEPAPDAPPVPSKVQHDVDVAENGNQKAFYSIREDSFPVAVIDAVPLRLHLDTPKVPVLKTGSLNLKVRAERTGEFKGPITLSLLYAPPGIGTPGTITIKEGETEANLNISANDKAPLAKWKVCVVGGADFGKGSVFVSTPLVDLEVVEPFLTGAIQRTFVDQGDTTTVTVKLDLKKPWEGKAKIALSGLPTGCTAEEQEVTADAKEVKFTVKAEKTAAAGQHRQLLCVFKLLKDGEEMNSLFAQGGVLRVDKASVASK